MKALISLWRPLTLHDAVHDEALAALASLGDDDRAGAWLEEDVDDDDL